MNDFNPWTGSDWYRVCILLIQLTFVVASVWFARNLLRALRAFQEQLGALLKVTITSTPTERSSEARPAAAASDRYWLMPSASLGESLAESKIDGAAEAARKGPSRIATAWHGVGLAWHGIGHWLNAPMRSSQISAWRRVMNWLQAPVGT